MQTSSVRQPQRARYLKIYDWQLLATDGNQAAAALINFFTFHHDRLMSNAEYPQAENTKGWQFHTDENIINGVLGLWKRDTISKGLDKLIAIGFLEDSPPAALVQTLKTGRVKGFRFRADHVRVWLDAYVARTHPTKQGSGDAESDPPGPLPPPKKKKTEPKKIDPTLAGQAREVFEDWKIVHMHPTAIEGDRLKYIVKLLKAGCTVPQLKLVNRGVLFSDWHQGRKEGSTKVWDKVSIVFRDIEQAEMFERLAIENGVTADNLDKFGKKPKREARLEEKPNWKRAIDNCPLCDEKGYIERDAVVSKCLHDKEK